jgi:hypothetical protein
MTLLNKAQEMDIDLVAGQRSPASCPVFKTRVR